MTFDCQQQLMELLPNALFGVTIPKLLQCDFQTVDCPR
jgi:hypothetical protein